MECKHALNLLNKASIYNKALDTALPSSLTGQKFLEMQPGSHVISKADPTTQQETTN